MLAEECFRHYHKIYDGLLEIGHRCSRTTVSKSVETCEVSDLASSVYAKTFLQHRIIREFNPGQSRRFCASRPKIPNQIIVAVALMTRHIRKWEISNATQYYTYRFGNPCKCVNRHTSHLRSFTLVNSSRSLNFGFTPHFRNFNNLRIDCDTHLP